MCALCTCSFPFSRTMPLRLRLYYFHSMAGMSFGQYRVGNRWTIQHGHGFGSMASCECKTGLRTAIVLDTSSCMSNQLDGCCKAQVTLFFFSILALFFWEYVDATQATNWSFHSDLFQANGWFPPSWRLCVARTRFVTCAASLFLDFAMEGVSTEVLVVLHELEPSWRVPFALCVVRSAFCTASHPMFRFCCSIPISLRIAGSHAPFAWCIG